MGGELEKGRDWSRRRNGRRRNEGGEELVVEWG